MERHLREYSGPSSAKMRKKWARNWGPGNGCLGIGHRGRQMGLLGTGFQPDSGRQGDYAERVMVPAAVGSGAVGRSWFSVGFSHLSDPDIVRLQLGSVALGRQLPPVVGLTSILVGL